MKNKEHDEVSEPVPVDEIFDSLPQDTVQKVKEALAEGCKFLFCFPGKEEMERSLDGKMYAIADSDGKFLCDIMETDFIRLRDEQSITEQCGFTSFSQWTVSSPECREKVLECRVKIIFTGTDVKPVS